MATSIPTLTALTADTLARAEDVGGNFTTIRDTVNADVLWLSKAGQTVSAAVTFSAAPVLSAGLTVSSGGITVTGNSTITGMLGGVTTLTCTTVSATTLGGTLSTAAQPNVTSLGTLTGLAVAGAKATLAASASGYASLNLPHGSAPTSPVNGDLWTTTAGLFARANGATVGPFSALPSLSDNGTVVTVGAGKFLRATDAWYAHVQMGGTQVMSGTANLLFDQEVADPMDMHSTSANTDRITVPANGDGLWLLSASVRINGGSPFSNGESAGFTVNGTLIGSSRQILGAAGAGVAAATITQVVSATAGQYFAVSFTTAGGVTLGNGTSFTAVRLG